jgi:aromatic-L-amino-acid decarboxylase
MHRTTSDMPDQPNHSAHSDHRDQPSQPAAAAGYASPHSLDPHDQQEWDGFRQQSHRMLDDMLSYLETLRERPVWQPIPEQRRAAFRQPLPRGPTDLGTAHRTFMNEILPYAVGNAHPGFMGWVHGGGNPVGMMAEMLAAGLNANLGGRDQMPIEVERQVLQWVRELFGFPQGASGLFVTGTSMANLIALLVARTAALGTAVRQEGVAGSGLRMVAYTSAAAHGCIAQAMDLAGFGTDALRRIPVDARRQIDTRLLAEAIAADRAQGLTPFFIAGTAGTVDTGAIDDLHARAALAHQERLWFHVDGAYGALGMLSPEIAPRLAGIECADSVAFDFHKWAQVPYDAGFILVRDGRLHHDTFAAPAAYLQRETRGMAAGTPWPCDFGPDLSRGFRALKTWFTIQVYGADRLGDVIAGTCALAGNLAALVQATPELELLAPVSLNIVCFRFRLQCGISAGDDSSAQAEDAINARIVIALQESGRVAPSSTLIDGRFAIRAAIVNHRTSTADIEALVASTIAFGRTFTCMQQHATT